MWLSKHKTWRVLFEQRGGWGDCFYLTQSSQHKKDMISNFILSEKNYLLTGWPRIKECLSYTEEEQAIINLIKKSKCCMIYLPTFRTKSNFDYKSVAKDIKDVIDENGILWIQKGHSADSNSSNKTIIEQNVVSLNAGFDINVLLPYSNVLITDYSSCFFEALYYNAGIIFYMPDYDEYTKYDRGISIDLYYMPGPKVHTIQELKEIIIKACKDANTAKTSQYNEIRDLYWKETQDKTMQDIWEDIKSQVNRK